MIMVQGYVYWSIYLRAATAKKVKDVHLPRIETALGHHQFKWEISSEKERPGIYRVINFQNIESASASELVLQVLKAAFSLVDGWHICGLQNLNYGFINGITGGWKRQGNINKNSSIDDMLFDISTGRVLGVNDDGGWMKED